MTVKQKDALKFLKEACEGVVVAEEQSDGTAYVTETRGPEWDNEVIAWRLLEDGVFVIL